MSAAAAAAAAAAASAVEITRPSHSSARRSSSSSSSYYNGDLNQDTYRYNNTHTYPFRQTPQTPEDDYYYELYQNMVQQLRSIEISVGELNNLPATRTVYQRNGNLYYRTSAQKALANEQREHSLAKAHLENHTMARDNLQPHQQPSGGNNH